MKLLPIILIGIAAVFFVNRANATARPNVAGEIDFFSKSDAESKGGIADTLRAALSAPLEMFNSTKALLNQSSPIGRTPMLNPLKNEGSSLSSERVFAGGTPGFYG